VLKTTKLLFLVVAAAALVVGCSQDYDQTVSPTSSPTGAASLMATGYEPVAASQLVSANLIVYVTSTSGQEVSIHNVTAPWDDMTVTFNSFGGAFDGASIGSFQADAWSYKYTDITPLVAGWLDGSIPNYGVLLQHDEMTSPLSGFASLQWDQSYNIYPMLEICYNSDAGVECMTSMAAGDAYIWEAKPDENFGSSEVLYAGYLVDSPLKKQALIRFEFDEEPPSNSGCSRTIGYWKNHCGFGRQADVVTPLLPVSLGSFEVSNRTIAHDILVMKTYGRPANGITKLMAQFLAVKLNGANGADLSAVAEEVAEADAFLTTHTWRDWYKLSQGEKENVLRLMCQFDNYNNGKIGPGHCDGYRNGCRKK
jgi:hypothetical protein